jgi:hypothetical protein
MRSPNLVAPLTRTIASRYQARRRQLLQSAIFAFVVPVCENIMFVHLERAGQLSYGRRLRVRQIKLLEAAFPLFESLKCLRTTNNSAIVAKPLSYIRPFLEFLETQLECHPVGDRLVSIRCGCDDALNRTLHCLPVRYVVVDCSSKAIIIRKFASTARIPNTTSTTSGLSAMRLSAFSQFVGFSSKAIIILNCSG